MHACVAAEPLGRLFTTVKERRILEERRQRQPDQETIDITDADLVIPDEPAEPETPVLEAITLQGVVTRESGGNTAWVNQSNNYEGNLSTQFIDVPAEQITPDGASIVMPDNRTRVKIRVGQTFHPTQGEIVDIVKPYANGR